MPTTIKGTFPTRREVEIAVEHLVQEYGLERTDIFIEPLGDANSSGTAPTGADVESGHDSEETSAAGAAYESPLLVSVDINEDEQDAVANAFRDAGATAVTSR